jgi:hypothetical protein
MFRKEERPLIDPCLVSHLQFAHTKSKDDDEDNKNDDDDILTIDLNSTVDVRHGRDELSHCRHDHPIQILGREDKILSVPSQLYRSRMIRIVTQPTSRNHSKTTNSIHLVFPSREGESIDAEESKLDSVARGLKMLLDWRRRLYVTDARPRSLSTASKPRPLSMGSNHSSGIDVLSSVGSITDLMTAATTPKTPKSPFLTFIKESHVDDKSFGRNVSNMLTSTMLSSRIFVASWNQGAKDPFEDRLDDKHYCARILKQIIPRDDAFDIIVLGLQEAVSENTYNAVETYLRPNDMLRLLPPSSKSSSEATSSTKDEDQSSEYQFVDRIYGRGDGSLMFPKYTGLAIYVRRSLITTGEVCYLSSGACRVGKTGSKGGVGILIRVLGSSVVFVNCHLAANSQTKRMDHYRKISSKLGPKIGLKDFELTDQFRHVVWMGDLNYRLVDVDAETVLSRIALGRRRELFESDGLILHQKQGLAWEPYVMTLKANDPLLRLSHTHTHTTLECEARECLSMYLSLVFDIHTHICIYILVCFASIDSLNTQTDTERHR